MYDNLQKGLKGHLYQITYRLPQSHDFFSNNPVIQSLESIPILFQFKP